MSFNIYDLEDALYKINNKLENFGEKLFEFRLDCWQNLNEDEKITLKALIREYSGIYQELENLLNY